MLLYVLKLDLLMGKGLIFKNLSPLPHFTGPKTDV